MNIVDFQVTSLAAGGDGVGRDAAGRVTFVPRTAPGDRVRVRLRSEKSSFARGELLEVIEPSPVRVAPVCAAFERGCGGCQWLHVVRQAQLDAKQALVTAALRKFADLVIEPIADPTPPLGWRRRARLHCRNGLLGLYAGRTHEVVPLASCPQLDPALDSVVQLLLGLSLPDGEIALIVGMRGDVAVGIDPPPHSRGSAARPSEAGPIERHWKPAAALIGQAGIVGVDIKGGARLGQPIVEIEPGLFGGPWDFAQASAAGNAVLVQLVRSALGPGPGAVLELYAGGGNFTRGMAADGWTVYPSDVVAPVRPPANFIVGSAENVVDEFGACDAIVLDPPREGAASVIAGIVRRAPTTIVYVSCDPATLARDMARLVEAGYAAERAWPIDLMPQTAHVEVVVRLVKAVSPPPAAVV
jgi:23S rRNA (uracil1939-C5)-methyltransferase